MSKARACGIGGHGKLLIRAFVRLIIRRKTGGRTAVYFTYTGGETHIVQPFYTDDYIFDVEKKDSIKTLLLTLWNRRTTKVTKTEIGELGSAVSAYIERIKADRRSSCRRSNTFYELYA